MNGIALTTVNAISNPLLSIRRKIELRFEAKAENECNTYHIERIGIINIHLTTCIALRNGKVIRQNLLV